MATWRILNRQRGVVTRPISRGRTCREIEDTRVFSKIKFHGFTEMFRVLLLNFKSMGISCQNYVYIYIYIV